ncbi:MAG: glycerate kinase type-2 family protein [Candidatus Binataceae bacterium]
MDQTANKSRRSRARAHLINLYAAAVSAVEPRRAITRAFLGQAQAMNGGAVEVGHLLNDAPKIRMLAVGKAALGMAAELAHRLDDRLSVGLVIAPGPSAAAPDPSIEVANPVWPRIKLLHAAHPIPDASSEIAGRAALDFAHATARDELFVLALSGGASALMAVPAAGISLADKAALSSALMRAGANIHELNAVRKHLSAIKGGGLLTALPGVGVVALVMSDVPGNDLGTIGSGPAASDPTTYNEAIAVLKRRGLWGRAPESIRDRLERGVAGEIMETLKPCDPRFERVTNVIVGDNRIAIDAAAEAGAGLGYQVVRVRDLHGEADQLGAQLAAQVCAITQERVCMIAGGEPVVTVRGTGAGGRAQQCALAMALELGVRGAGRCIMAIFAGTDGVDGPTDAAGAIITPETIARASEAGFDAQVALHRNDSYPLFKALGDALLIGPTGTNVADVFIALINFQV